MMITSEELRGALERLEPWHWRGSDWRKIGRKIVRFVDWRKLGARR
jgi:hypothetical protein